MTAELYDHKAESAVLSVLLDAAAIHGPDRARDLLDRERLTEPDFHSPPNAATFAAVAALLRKGQVPEAISLSEALRGNDAITRAGGPKWLAQLQADAHNAIDFALPGYAKTIRELALRRRMVAAAKDLLGQAQDLRVGVDQTLTTGSATLAALGNRHTEARTVRELFMDVLDELDALTRGESAGIIPTGIEALDSVIGGLQPTLTVVGALPGIGKSALLATVARNLSKAGVRVGVFSLEDDGTWLPWRYLADESGLSQAYLRTRRLNEFQGEKVAAGGQRICDYGDGILVDDRSALSPSEVVQGARDMILNRGVQVVMVDHLGELRHNSGRKERFDLDVAEGLSDLRSIAKTHGVPVWVAAHLSRKADEVKPGEAPKLSYFANSAAIERQARVALGLARDPGSGRLVVYVLKQTNGKPNVKVMLDFHGEAAMVRNTGGHVEELGKDGQ
jgi:replicative DNA helicase